jgi:hypothetical protein
MWPVLVLGIIVMLLTILMVSVARPPSLPPRPRQPMVHCIMVTGRDETRVRLARVSLANFLTQTHPNRRLIIVNEHPGLAVVETPLEGVVEVRYDRSAPGASLGGMRNTALDLVPVGDMWITWDDDDYRHETFLSALVDVAWRESADAVLHVRRLEHNVKTGFTWGYERREGLWIVLATKAGGVRYRELDANEDRDIREQIRATSRRWAVWDNDPHVYIRTIHGRNTNTSVDPGKHALTGGGDFEVGDEDRQYVRDKLAPIRQALQGA